MAKHKIDIAEALVVQTDKGNVVRRIDKTITLSQAEKTLVKVGSMKVNNSWVPNFAPSAAGVRRIGTVSGILAVPADEVTVGGVRQPNGYRDPESNVIYNRYRAYGFNEMGLPCVSDRTVSYSVDAYNRQDLLAQAKNKVSWLKVLPKGISDTKKQDMIDEGWGCYNIDEAFDVWADGSKAEFLKMKGAMEHRQIHADRTCQTFAERNAMAAHPGMPSNMMCNTDRLSIDCKMWYAPEGGMRWDNSTFSVKAMEKCLEAHGEIVEDKSDDVEEVTEMAQSDPAVKHIVDEVASQDMEQGRQREVEDDDDLPFDDPKPEAKEDTQKAELVKRIRKLVNDPEDDANYNVQERSFVPHLAKACEVEGLDPAELEKADTMHLIEVDTLLRASIGNIQ